MLKRKVRKFVRGIHNNTKNKAKMKDNFVIGSFLSAILLIFSIGLISSAGVSTPYWSTNPLKLQPGESSIVTLGLQNMVGGEDIILRANITKGGEIAKIIDESPEYFVMFGTENVTVNIEVSIPENAEVNKSHSIEVSFLQGSSSDGGGFFALASAFTQRIPVLVVGEPTESAAYNQGLKSRTNNLTWIIVGLIILIVFILILINRQKGKR